MKARRKERGWTGRIRNDKKNVADFFVSAKEEPSSKAVSVCSKAKFFHRQGSERNCKINSSGILLAASETSKTIININAMPKFHVRLGGELKVNKSENVKRRKNAYEKIQNHLEKNLKLRTCARSTF